MARPSTIGLAVALVLAAGGLASAAPKRPSASAGACSISNCELDQLAATHPAGAEACRRIPEAASKSGRAFAFMCDGLTGAVSCCDESTCVALGTATKPTPTLPPARTGDQPGSTLQPRP